MNIFYHLAVSDLAAVKSWFSTQTVSKLLVVSGFGAVFAALGAGLFHGSGWIFMILAPLNIYGRLTAEYILRAAILIIFWLGVGSSTVSALTGWSSRNRNLNFLLTLPIKGSYLAIWHFFRSVLTNAVLLTFFILPLLLAYARSFSGSADITFPFRACLTILVLALITTSIGSVTAAVVAGKIQKIGIFAGMGLVAGFFLATAGLFKLVFSPQLFKMTLALPGEFMAMYQQLPLSHGLLPTGFMTELVVGGSVVSFILTLALTLVICLPCLYWLKNNFIKTAQIIAQRQLISQFVPGRSDIGRFEAKFEKISPKIVLAEKDLISIIRSTAESGYGLFLLLMITAFFGLFSAIKLDTGIGTEWINHLIVFSYLGLAFFANTYYLRLVMPLMARESESAWYLFSLPVDRLEILKQKLLAALAVSYPLIFLAVTLWWILPYARPHQLVLTAASLWLVLLLPVLHTFLGAIYPNFSQGNDPEKVTTSTMGILTLVISSVITLIFAMSLFRYLTGDLVLSSVAGIFIFITMLSLFTGAKISSDFLKKYDEWIPG